MRKTLAGVLTLALTTGLTLATSSVTTASTPSAPAVAAPGVSGPDSAAQTDDLPNPAEDKRRELREQAVNGVLQGELKPEQRNGSTVVKVGSADTAAAARNGRKVSAAKSKSQYVELARETTDRVFVILTEFGNKRHPGYPDQDTNPAIPGPAVFDGPLNNQIPKPDRTNDNSTVWQANYDRAHFQQIYFGSATGVESLKTYYERQSSGRYSISRHRHRLGHRALQRGPVRPVER